jgi:hypothetical protein
MKVADDIASTMLRAMSRAPSLQTLMSASSRRRSPLRMVAHLPLQCECHILRRLTSEGRAAWALTSPTRLARSSDKPGGFPTNSKGRAMTRERLLVQHENGVEGAAPDLLL